MKWRRSYLEARLDEPIGGLKGEVSNVNDQFADLAAEKEHLLSLPSSSQTLTYLDVVQDSYKKWIPAKAQLDIFRDLMVAWRVTKVEFEGAHSKACTV